MTQNEILKELEKLTIPERLTVIETVLRSIRGDLRQRVEESSTSVEEKRQLSEAAKTLLSDYTSDNELTAFTVLDGEDFRA